MSIFMSVQYHVDYYSYVVGLENLAQFYNLVLLFSFLETILSVLGPLNFHINFKISLLISKKKLGFSWVLHGRCSSIEDIDS